MSPVTVATAASRLDEILNLAIGELLTRPCVHVFASGRYGCPILSGWRLELKTGLCHVLGAPMMHDCRQCSRTTDSSTPTSGVSMLA
jgi:hypothetical protein